MFDWEKIGNKNAVHCKTEKEAEMFLTECDKRGIEWCREGIASSKSNWEIYKESTVYYIGPSDEKEGLTFSSISHFKEEGYTIFEFSDLYKPDLPRICYILGGEDNPLKVGEKFKISGCSGTFAIGADGHVYGVSSCGKALHFILEDIINGELKIIRQPQFSEDERAFMRLCVEAGYPWFARDKDESLYAYESRPKSIQGDAFSCDGDFFNLPESFLPQITFENSLFNAADYLEGAEK
ncbi:hypothetical protein FL966_12375 [Caproiciproducens galactitolivorans]|uniref:Uncharacterized protein n=1 Tax=Caproiciproducens galactitolivorans TaxID=642589 RepID=A0A4Z0YF35_9FIRM|nr:hypothetical protein [Caproiciproducens galactitolivorans]QEY35793.1 hypothetical protein FL966_12375 [Caproiciproducens galactitolivorans]TGJ77530.1 hypothetical protein CAGA_09040 [Caproiciproducens galactitolivorans]